MNKKILNLPICLILSLFTLASCAKKVEVTQYEGYNLLWNDEFSGSKLNDKIWNKEIRPSGWTNHELQAYTQDKENIYVKDGKLVLKAVQHTLKSGSHYYTSGKVQTSHKKDFMYGRVVVRAKAPKGQGLWPAIWMMPTDEKYGNWPVCGEIDIMEVLGNDTTKTHGTIHYGAPHGQKQGTYVTKGASFSDDFHEFMIDWEPGEFRWYIDGELYFKENNWFARSRAGEDFDYPAPFNQNFFIQLNLAVGGDWPGDPDESTDFNKAQFEIDYIRVYQKDEYDMNVTRPEVKMPPKDENGNYIHNGDFKINESLSDIEDWQFLLAGGGQGNATIKDGMLVIESSNAGTVDYSVQLVHRNIGSKKGKKYVISFDAKADAPRTIKVAVTAPEVNWIRYYPDTLHDIGTNWKTYTIEYTMRELDDAFGRLEFNLGNQGSTDTFYLKNVSLKELD